MSSVKIHFVSVTNLFIYYSLSLTMKCTCTGFLGMGCVRGDILGIKRMCTVNYNISSFDPIMYKTIEKELMSLV